MAKPRGKADNMEEYSSTSIASIKKIQNIYSISHSPLTTHAFPFMK
jgi:hypothetical protein